MYIGSLHNSYIVVFFKSIFYLGTSQEENNE